MSSVHFRDQETETEKAGSLPKPRLLHGGGRAPPRGRPLVAVPLCGCFASSCLFGVSLPPLGCELGCDSRDCSGHRCVLSGWDTPWRLVGPPGTFADVQMRTDGRRTAQGAVRVHARLGTQGPRDLLGRGQLRARGLRASPYDPGQRARESQSPNGPGWCAVVQLSILSFCPMVVTQTAVHQAPAPCPTPSRDSTQHPRPCCLPLASW